MLSLNEDYTPFSVKRDSMIEEICEKNSVIFRSFEDLTLISKRDLQDRFPPSTNLMFKKFTAYYKATSGVPVRKVDSYDQFQNISSELNPIESLSLS
jgi:deoxyribodipyrimidine photolyase